MAIDSDQHGGGDISINDMQGVTDMAASFIDYVMEGFASKEAAKRANVPSNMVNPLLRQDNVRRLLHEARERRIATDLACKALKTIERLMDASNPPAVQLNAAKLILEAAGHGAKQDRDAPKSLDQMTPGELADFIAKADGQLHKRAEAAKPVIQAVAQGSADQQ